MSAKSKGSSESKNPKRPFEPAVMDKARKAAEKYQVVLSLEGGHWYGRGLELPNVYADAESSGEAVENTHGAMAVAVATMMEQGVRPPLPANAGRRTEQVNVRLSSDERLLLENAAQRKGFMGMSDFIRVVAVEAAS